jgi:cytochrome bd-type quinol oxidase subunit 2
MNETWLTWLAVLFFLLAAYAVCLITAKKRKPQLLHLISGMAFGFCFDIVSFTNGYYSYPGIYPITFMGLPVTMTVAEGFSVAITIRLFEVLKGRMSGKGMFFK